MKFARKDNSPDATINNIKKILSNVGIETEESYYIHHENAWHSVRLEIKGLNGVGVNGKGISKDLALASAYGELIERIQTQALLNPLFHAMNKESYRLNDVIEMEFDVDSISRLFSDDINIEYITENPDLYLKTLGAPFYNVFDNITEYLPIKLVENYIGSNGICAGNTPAEAISHGICEIFERYVHKEILKAKWILPLIDMNEINGTVAYSMINELQQRGYDVRVKDCSLGGKFPVVGVLLLNPNKTKYIFHVGSDLDLDIAIQRCITEIFQGVHLDNLDEKRLLPINFIDHLNFENYWDGKSGLVFRYREWIKTVTSGKGQHPINVFLNEDCAPNNPKYKSAFLFKQFDNKEGLLKLVDIVKNEGLKLYVRDLSFLGFPTYRVFIDKISDVTMITLEEISYLKNFKKVRELYTKVNEINGEEMLKINNLINIGRNIPSILMTGVINNLYRINFNNDYERLELNDLFVMASNYSKCGQYDKAFNELKNLVIQEYGGFNNPEFSKFLPILIYLRNKQAGVKDEMIKKLISDMFFKSEIEIFNEFFVLAKRPNCPECSDCKIKAECNYIIWGKLMKAIKSKEMKLSQSNLLSLF